MKKGIVLGVVFLFFMMSFTSISGNQTNNQTIDSSDKGDILYVGGSGEGNYTTIQSAIDNASDSDTVFVYDDSSPYYENIYINKIIQLKGEDKETTIIDGNNTNNVIQIFVDYVTVSGFTIRDSGKYNKSIYVSSNRTIISGNIVTGSSRHTIKIDGGRYNTITNNILTNSSNYCVYLLDSDFNFVTENTIFNNDAGIRFTRSDQNHIGLHL